MLLLDQISQIPGQQTATIKRGVLYRYSYNVKILIYRHLRLLLFQVLQISLEVVIGLRLGLQIAIDLTDLLGDNVGDVAQRLLDRILGHVPLEAGQVLG